jgi:predicted MFS family arabinose efflux permease
VTSRRATILLAIALTLGMLLPGLARSLPFLVAAAFVFGMSKGALDVSMNTHAVAILRAWGSPIMSSFHAAFSMGGLLGSIVMGFVFAQGFDVTTALSLMTVAALPVVATAAVLGFSCAGRHRSRTPSCCPSHSPG